MSNVNLVKNIASDWFKQNTLQSAAATAQLSFAVRKNWQGLQKLLKEDLHKEMKHKGNAT